MVVRDLSKMSGQLKSGGFRPVMQADQRKKGVGKRAEPVLSVLPLYRQISDTLLGRVSARASFPWALFARRAGPDRSLRGESPHNSRGPACSRRYGLWSKDSEVRGTLVLSTEAHPLLFKWCVLPLSYLVTPTAVYFRLLSDDRIIRLTRHSRGSWAVRQGMNGCRFRVCGH